jgi:hypothetical protein
MLRIAKLLLLAHFCICSITVQAQNENLTSANKHALEANALEAKGVEVTKNIKVRNLSADTVAFWLRPLHSPLSSLDARSYHSWIAAGYDEATAPRLQPPVPAALPPDARIIAVIREQNALQIAGNPLAVQEAETLIAKLDQPLEQVEVECQVMAVDSAALKAAPWTWTPSGKTLSGAPMQETKADRHFHSTLNKWMEARQVEMLTSPRVVALNGVAAGLRSENKNISEVQIYDGSRYLKFSPSVDKKNSLAFIESLGLTVFPEIQKEGNIRARVQVSRNLFLGIYKMTNATPEEKEGLKAAIEKEGLTGENNRKAEEFGWGIEQDRHLLRSAEGLDREIIAKDGDTLVFSGFNAKEFWGNWMSKEQTRKLRGKTAIVSVTLRRVRRLTNPSA